MSVATFERPASFRDSRLTAVSRQLVRSDHSSSQLKVTAEINNWRLSGAGDFYEFEICLTCQELPRPWMVWRSFAALKRAVD